LITHFSTSILVKKSSTELFFITQLEGEITRAYLKRFNEEMLKVENLLELMVIEALINGIHNYFLWKCLMHYLIKVFSIWNKLWKIIPMWKKQMYHDKSCQDELGPPWWLIWSHRVCPEYKIYPFNVSPLPVSSYLIPLGLRPLMLLWQYPLHMFVDECGFNISSTIILHIQVFSNLLFLEVRPFLPLPLLPFL